jgi:hypothetical protein
MDRKLRRNLAVGTSTLAAAAFGGGAYAATQTSTRSARQAFLNDVAKRLNVTPQDLSAALQGAFIDRLNAAVAAGKLTQAQANRLEQRLREGGALPLRGVFLGPEHRFFGIHEGPFAGGLAAGATYLGLTRSQLRDQIAAGKSLAQIATARGKSVTGLEQALLAGVRSKLDGAVSAKRITSAEEQQILGRLSAHIQALVNHAGFGSGRDRPY